MNADEQVEATRVRRLGETASSMTWTWYLPPAPWVVFLRNNTKQKLTSRRETATVERVAIDDLKVVRPGESSESRSKSAAVTMSWPGAAACSPLISTRSLFSFLPHVVTSTLLPRPPNVFKSR